MKFPFFKRTFLRIVERLLLLFLVFPLSSLTKCSALPLILFIFHSTVTWVTFSSEQRALKGRSWHRMLAEQNTNSNSLDIKKKYLRSSSKEARLNNLGEEFIMFWWRGKQTNARANRQGMLTNEDWGNKSRRCLSFNMQISHAYKSAIHDIKKMLTWASTQSSQSTWKHQQVPHASLIPLVDDFVPPSILWTTTLPHECTTKKRFQLDVRPEIDRVFAFALSVGFYCSQPRRLSRRFRRHRKIWIHLRLLEIELKKNVGNASMQLMNNFEGRGT